MYPTSLSLYLHYHTLVIIYQLESLVSCSEYSRYGYWFLQENLLYYILVCWSLWQNDHVAANIKYFQWRINFFLFQMTQKLILKVVTFHKSVSSWLEMSPESMGIPMTKNLSLEIAESWNPAWTITVTDTDAPGLSTPKHGRTRYVSGDVVFNWNHKNLKKLQWTKSKTTTKIIREKECI